MWMWNCEVQALIDGGFLNLVVDLPKVKQYWEQILKDFPGHPASASPEMSFPMSIYGDSGY